ncbi:hypothetical protein CRENBAI_022882 [Crenichthys baileyi]|uniref:Phosphorylase b kinase regulatory subunit n=1 Tax=Crenichthys baileyi TaxID=28760 RepID=A0AAV9RCM1_9TELE
MENNLLQTVKDKELARKFKERQMKKKAVANKPLDDTSACKIGSKQQRERESYGIQEQATQTLIKDNEFELNQDLENPNNHLLTTLSKHSNQNCVSSITKRETCQSVSEQSEGVQSRLEFLQHERKNTLPQKARFRNKCKQIVYDQLTDIKRKEAADEALMEESLVQKMAEQEIAQKLRDKMDEEKQAATKKSLTDSWEAQIQNKQQKRKERAETERKEKRDEIESARLYQIEQNEKRRYKTPNLCEGNSNPVSVKDERDKQLKKAVSPRKQQKINTQDEFQFEHNTDDQNLTQRETCQPVGEEREGVQSRLEFLQHERKNTLPQKARFRNKCKEIVYDQLTDIKRKEAADEALMEESLVQKMAEQEIAQILRDKMDEEKQAATKKSLTDSWEAQIQDKQQKKRERAETERKEKRDEIESGRLYQIEQNEKRRYKTPNLCEGNSNPVSVKDERDEQLKKAVSPRKQQKINTQDEFQFEHNTDDQNLTQRETCQPVGEESEGVQSRLEFLQHERKNTLPQKARFRNKCKQIVYDLLTDIKRKEAADEALMEESLVQKMAEQEIAQKLRDKMDEEKQAATKKSLTDSWEAQIQNKQQKRKERAETERKEKRDEIESARLYQIEQNEKRRYKTPNLCEGNSNPVSVKDERDKQLKKPLSPRKQQKINTQDEFQFEHNTDDQNLTQRETCQPVGEEREGVQSRLEFLQHERKNTLPQKVRFRNKCKEIVYDQLTDIKRKEAADEALMEESLVQKMAEQEIAQILRDKMDEEKQAATKKSLTDSWEAQIQDKQQKKRERAETERKEKRDEIESARLYQIEKEKNIQLERNKQAAYLEAQAALLAARPRKRSVYQLFPFNLMELERFCDEDSVNCPKMCQQSAQVQRRETNQVPIPSKTHNPSSLAGEKIQIKWHRCNHRDLCGKAYRFLAVNKKLGLSGRPDRPVGCIGTCKIYRILGKTVVCYPIVFDLSDFYLSQDVMLLIDDIKNALQFIKQCWKMQGRPLFLVLIREDNIKGSRFNPVLDMLASFKKGIIGGVKVHVDRLQLSEQTAQDEDGKESLSLVTLSPETVGGEDVQTGVLKLRDSPTGPHSGTHKRQSN